MRWIPLVLSVRCAQGLEQTVQFTDSDTQHNDPHVDELGALGYTCSNILSLICSEVSELIKVAKSFLSGFLRGWDLRRFYTINLLFVFETEARSEGGRSQDKTPKVAEEKRSMCRIDAPGSGGRLMRQLSNLNMKTSPCHSRQRVCVCGGGGTHTAQWQLRSGQWAVTEAVNNTNWNNNQRKEIAYLSSWRYYWCTGPLPSLFVPRPQHRCPSAN